MGLDRRTFIGMCGATVAAGFLGGHAVAFGRVSKPMVGDGVAATAAGFAPHVGERFVVEGAKQGPVELTLIRVAEVPERALRDQRGKLRMKSFSLFFDGTGEKALAQDVYTFKHATLGSMSWMTTPVVAKDPKSREYEVVINHLLD